MTRGKDPRRNRAARMAALQALGDEIDGGHRTSANEDGLRALGDRIENAEKQKEREGGTSPRHVRPRSRRSGRPKWSIKRKVFTAALIVIVVAGGVIGAGYGYARYEFNQIPKAVCHTCAQVAAGKPYNLLVVGSDTRSGDTGQASSSFGSASVVGGQRSDTIKIVHIDPAAGTARVLSIPRDTYVTTSGLAQDTGLAGPEKINAAFNNGPDALIETIQNTFGIPISHWIVIDFNGVIDSIDALGGVSLDFKYPVRDYNSETGVNESGLDIPHAGCQVLTGNSALSLSRSRYYEYYEGGEWQQDPGSDLSRIQRQNTLIQAMISKASSTYNPVTLQRVVKSVVKDISIDNKLSLGMIYDLAERYHAFSASSLQTWTLPTVPQLDTPAGSVELANTEAPNNYVDTIAEFLGQSPGPVTTPPLDQNGQPITVPAVTPTTAPPTSTTSPNRPTGTTAPPVATTTAPSYEPTLCS